MPHQRQLIRQAVRDLLIGKTAAGTRVSTTRIYPYRKPELPAISVYTLEETVNEEGSNTAPREYTRDLELEISGFVHGGADVDDAMDELALEIENAMAADPYLGGTVGDSMLQGTTMGLTGDGDTLTGMVTLTYAVTYRTLAPEAPSGLDEFETAGVTHQPAGVGDAEVAEDLINVRSA